MNILTDYKVKEMNVLKEFTEKWLNGQFCMLLFCLNTRRASGLMGLVTLRNGL